MNHLSFKGDHYEMGVMRGKLLKESGVTIPLHLDEFQRRHGEMSERLLRKFFPEVCEEIRGVSETIGVDYTTFAAWLLCMGCCMYNLESNIPCSAREDEIRGCTAFAFSVDRNVIYGRNNDLPPFLKDKCNNEMYHPSGGNRFSLTTSSLINGEEGLNEHGLAVAMTFVMTRLEMIRPGFNSCFIVRYLLEKAKSASHALSLLWELPVASNCNILIADPSGEMMVVECTPFVKRVREAKTLPQGSLVCTVNSFTSEEMALYDAAHGDDYQSARRYQTVMESFPTILKEISAAAEAERAGQKYTAAEAERTASKPTAAEAERTASKPAAAKAERTEPKPASADADCDGLKLTAAGSTEPEPALKAALIKATQELLKGRYGFICQYDDSPEFETVWSSVFDLKSRTIWRAEGDPRTTAFSTFSGI